VNKKSQIDLGELIDTEVFYEPAYWIIVGIQIIGLMIAWGGGEGLVGGIFGEGYQIPFYIKLLVFILIMPIGYIIFKLFSK
jgi:hypothetical protein